jgi:hypothetical protein
MGRLDGSAQTGRTKRDHNRTQITLMNTHTNNAIEAVDRAETALTQLADRRTKEETRLQVIVNIYPIDLATKEPPHGSSVLQAHVELELHKPCDVARRLLVTPEACKYFKQQQGHSFGVQMTINLCRMTILSRMAEAKLETCTLAAWDASKFLCQTYFPSDAPFEVTLHFGAAGSKFANKADDSGGDKARKNVLHAIELHYRPDEMPELVAGFHRMAVADQRLHLMHIADALSLTEAFTPGWSPPPLVPTSSATIKKSLKRSRLGISEPDVAWCGDKK